MTSCMDCKNKEHRVSLDNKMKCMNEKPLIAIPQMLKFDYEESSSNAVKQLKILNVNSTLHRLHVLPPLTNFFKITQLENGWIAPGMSISINVSFLPSKVEKKRHYRDCIRILNDSKAYNLRNILSGKEDVAPLHGSMLLIPLTAEPGHSQSKIPDEINFGCVKLGKRAESTITISSSTSEKVIFFISVPDENTNFKIDPLQGILQENDPPAKIMITFTPTEYKIVNLKIRVCIPSYSITPYSVLLTGASKPWHINKDIINTRKDLKENKEQEKGLQKSKIARQCIELRERKGSSIHNYLKKSMREKSCISKVPLNTTHGVAKFLSSQQSKDKDLCFDLIGPLGKYQDEEKVMYNEHQSIFLRMVKKEKDRRQNIHFSNQVALGKSRHSFDLDELAEIMFQRQISDINYQKSQELFKEDFLLNNNTAINLQRRTVRHLNEVIPLHMTTVSIDTSFIRYQILSKFIKCARKLIIKNRLTKRLEAIKALFINKEIPE